MGCKSCRKPNPQQRKGLWSPEEDQKVRDYIVRFGHTCWSSVPVKAGLARSGKSCRLRWINYLRPGLKHGMFSREEEVTVMRLHAALGNKWSLIARQLPGRTDNEVKNNWHSYLKKRVQDEHRSPTPGRSSGPPVLESSSSADASSCLTGPGAATALIRPVLPKVMFADWLHADYGTTLLAPSALSLDDAAFGASQAQGGVSHQGSLQVDSRPCSAGAVGSFHGLGDGNICWELDADQIIDMHELLSMS